VRTTVPGEDQSGSADSDRAERHNYPSSGVTARSGITPATAAALESRSTHDVLPRPADAVHQQSAAAIIRRRRWNIVDLLRGRALSQHLQEGEKRAQEARGRG